MLSSKENIPDLQARNKIHLSWTPIAHSIIVFITLHSNYPFTCSSHTTNYELLRMNEL